MDVFEYIMIILTLIRMYISQTVCNTTHKTCFDCVADSNCEWSSGCKNGSNQYGNINWYLKYQQCADDLESKRKMSYHCNGYNSNSVPMTGILNKVGGKYSMNNLICKYIIQEEKGKKLTITNVKEEFSSMKNDLYAITYTYANNTQETYIITDKNYKFEAKIKEIVFLYYSPTIHSVHPFILEVQYYKGLNVITIITLLVLVFFGCVFIGLLIVGAYTVIAKIKLKRMLNDEEPSRLALERNSREINKKYHQYINELLKEQPYDSNIHFFDIQCSICHDVYLNETLVVQLKCNHIFHNECIQKYINTTLIGQAKCPNCNDIIVDTATMKIIQQSVIDSEIIIIGHNINLLNNTNRTNDQITSNPSNQRLIRNVEQTPIISSPRTRIDIPLQESRNVAITENISQNMQFNHVENQFIRVLTH